MAWHEYKVFPGFANLKWAEGVALFMKDAKQSLQQSNGQHPQQSSVFSSCCMFVGRVYSGSGGGIQWRLQWRSRPR